MQENEITFAEFQHLLDNCSKFDVIVTPDTALPWDDNRIFSYILNQEKARTHNLHYFMDLFPSHIFYAEVRNKNKRVFLFRITE